jgi:hypothetical protein
MTMVNILWSYNKEAVYKINTLVILLNAFKSINQSSVFKSVCDNFVSNLHSLSKNLKGVLKKRLL